MVSLHEELESLFVCGERVEDQLHLTWIVVPLVRESRDSRPMLVPLGTGASHERDVAASLAIFVH